MLISPRVLVLEIFCEVSPKGLFAWPPRLVVEVGRDGLTFAVVFGADTLLKNDVSGYISLVKVRKISLSYFYDYLYALLYSKI